MGGVEGSRLAISTLQVGTTQFKLAVLYKVAFIGDAR